ncbi:MAG: hypothetical protein QN141_01870 [Armatimonadota bacterium]|nr:hypothetical protein [Armatimonadota bacterium]MDR7450973.1 hypothetical protein [Armatimonadota bacterium]MDR7466006.1 hypothetical protein [Armatimonadota bacterium]MDR7494071.1 hypothetical protein [Armatimonadota bacterium]MDR7504062.1 hypothetical protein [Armatimonadota bacterium]
MEVTIADQGIFLLPTRLTPEQARERVLEQKFNVFGTLSKLLIRPKGEEIQIGLSEFRYHPFWHAVGHKRFRFARRAQYRVSIAKEVQSVEIAGQAYAPSGGTIVLPGQEDCLIEERNELFLDGLSSDAKDLSGYLQFDPQAVGDGIGHDVALVPPEVRAADVIRRVLGDVLHPPSADKVLEETVAVPALNLYYRPVYAFEYRWESKGKRAVAEVDALTGEFRAAGSLFGEKLRKVLNRDVLFDIGGETLNLVVPGGAIALKLTKAIADRRKAGPR